MNCEICGEDKYLFDGRDVLIGKNKKPMIPVPYEHICQQCYHKKVHEILEEMK